MPRLLRWLIAVVASVAVFTVVWWAGQAAALGRADAIAVSAFAGTVALAGLAWWAARDTETSAAVSSARSATVGGNVGQNVVSGDGNIITTTHVHVPAAREAVVRVRSVEAMPRAAAGFLERPEFDDLCQVLSGSARAVVAAVAGGRGVGKTQLAAAYCRLRAGQEWPVVVWVNAESEPTMIAGLGRLAARIAVVDAARIGVVDVEASPVEAARAAVAWLTEHSGPGVVVFDNAEDPDLVGGWIPAAGPVQMVITTTDRRFTRLGTAVNVGLYTEDQAVAYLIERTGVDDPAGAGRVAAEVGLLPLAVAQAAALIGGARYPTYQAYLTALAGTDVRELLAHVAGDPYPAGFSAAILLAIDTVTTEADGGMLRRMLDVLAVLSPDGVPIAYLTHLARAAGAATPAVAIGTWVEALVERSLVTLTADRDEVVLHRLIGRTLRDLHRAAGTLDDVIATAAAMLDAAIPLRERHEVVYRPVWRRLGPQVTTIREHVTDTTATVTADLVMRLGWNYLYHLIGVSDFRRAVEVGPGVVADAERLLGDDHPDTLGTRNNLALAYGESGRLPDAIALDERNLTDMTRVLGDDHPDTMRTRNGLANSYRVSGRVAEAMALDERNLADRVRVLGEDHPETLATRGNLASSYRALGRVAEAIVLHERNQDDRVRVLGDDHPSTLTTRNNLANAYHDAGRVAEAIALHERNLADMVRVLGDDHPDTMRTRNGLANSYWASGRMAEAIALHERNLADRVRVLGDDHPETLTSRNNLADAQRAAKARQR